jgi:hypothetical protein
MGLYFRRGQSAARWLPTVASTTAGPTLAEYTAGVDLTPAITAIAGLETSLNRINTAVMNAREELQTNGPQTLGDATLTILDDDGTVASGSTQRTAARTALAENANGYVFVLPHKVTATTGDKGDLFPALVGAVNRDYSLDAQLARSVVQLAITGAPRKEVALT